VRKTGYTFTDHTCFYSAFTVIPVLYVEIVLYIQEYLLDSFLL